MSDRHDENGRTEGVGAPESISEQSRRDFNSTTHSQSATQKSSRVPTLEVKQLEPYFAAGFELIPINGKAPFTKTWRSDPALQRAEANARMRKGDNVGVRLAAEDLVLDVDPRNFVPGDDPIERLEADTGFQFRLHCPTVVTGRHGLHLYLKKPVGLVTVGALAAYRGIDFQTVGKQVVAAGSTHPETGAAYRWDELSVAVSSAPTAPKALLSLLQKSDVAISEELGDCEPSEVEAMLDALDPADAAADYQSWLEIGMMVHHATAGSEEGKELFAAWSARDASHGDDGAIEARAKWRSFDNQRSGKRKTVRSLLKILNKHGAKDIADAYFARRRSAAEDDFPDDVELLVAADQAWATEWVWIAEADQFVRRDDGKRWRKETWRTMYASKWQDGDVLNAVWKGKLPLRRLESLVYLPEQREFPDGDAPTRYNIWRKSGVDAVPGDVSIFLDHMEHLFPDEADREHVLDYLALLVQFPAAKIHFALLIRGAQGTGKSWIGVLMERIIGAPNVVRPSNEEVTSRWTAWMEGAQLAILEEMMTLGRREVANRFKPAITDTTLRIEGKGLPLYSIPNCLNFICFTNHSDALPIENGDRRWLIVFSPAKKREQPYYDRLFGFLDREGGAAFVKHWLLSRSVKLEPRGVAPWTEGKSQMLESSLGDMEHYLLELFSAGQAPFNFDLVRLEDVVEAVPAHYRGRGSLRPRIVRFLREELGSEQHSRYTKGENGRPAYQLWSIRNHADWSSIGAAKRVDAFVEHRIVFPMA